MKNKLLIAAFILLGIAVLAARMIGTGRGAARAASRTVAERTWAGYKKYLIEASGRVLRPRENDTVSEGQAYAMLRAVWMGDKKTFDACYRWTEEHLSRDKEKGDRLLAWLWKKGAVVDWMPASDADVDYAMSLIFAERLWPRAAPEGLADYGRRARETLDDILRLLTYRTASGRLYLSPWILEADAQRGLRPVNPSYYSPAYFRVFFEVTGDRRWRELVETSYYILTTLSARFNGQDGKGLVPDWCSVDEGDRFGLLENKSGDFGWESVRVPLRIATDHYWFQSPEAKDLLGQGFCRFIKREWDSNNKVFCEYRYDGTPVKAYESPLFYAAYASALQACGSPLAAAFLDKTRSFLVKDGTDWVYQAKDEYFVNSLAWFAEGLDSGIIRVIKEKGGRR